MIDPSGHLPGGVWEPLERPEPDGPRDAVLRYVDLWNAWQALGHRPGAGDALWHRIVMAFEQAGVPLTCIWNGDVTLCIEAPASDCSNSGDHDLG